MPEKLRALIDYAKGNAIVHSLFAITYGLITIFFGDELWELGHVYSSAKQVPYAPESWGILAIFCGVIILFGVFRGNFRSDYRGEAMIRVGCLLFSAWCFVFAILFAWDCVKYKTPIGLPGVANYLYMALLVVHRGVLAKRISEDR